MRGLKFYLQVVAMALIGSCLIVTPVGCTAADAQKAVAEIDAYLPTAIQLAEIVIQAIGAAQSQGLSAEAQSTGNTILSDLKELQTLTDAYLAQPSDTTWHNIQNLLETIINTNQSALEAAVGIKSHDAKTAYIAAITGLSAALAVLDGYVNSTKTTAQLKAKAQVRRAKLSAQVRYWSDADKQRVSSALGVDFNTLQREALAYGL
jgi:hypothetical protein